MSHEVEKSLSALIFSGVLDRFPDLPETPAQFQERCGQVALRCFWNETHAGVVIELGPMPREIVPMKEEPEAVADGDFLSVS